MSIVTISNKLIMSNKKDQMLKVGAASALIMAVASYRGLEDEDKEISVGKLTTFSLAVGTVAGLIWGLTKASLSHAGKGENTMIKDVLRQVTIIGVASTLMDMEDERVFRRNTAALSGKSSYGKYSYSSSGSSSSNNSSAYSTYPRTVKSYTSIIDSDDDESDFSDSALSSIAISDGRTHKYKSAMGSSDLSDSDDDQDLTAILRGN